jgi:hypothetical protein
LTLWRLPRPEQSLLLPVSAYMPKSLLVRLMGSFDRASAHAE